MKKPNRPLFRVAVIYCKGVFYHTHAHYGFCRAIKKMSRGRIVIEDYIATNLSVSQMSKLARKAVGSNPDMIVAIGRIASHQVINYQTNKETTVPLVCIGADDLEKSMTSHMRPLTTGVVTKIDNPLLPAQLLLYLKKNIARVFLPYKAERLVPSIEKSILSTLAFLRSKGVEAVPLPFTQVDDLYAKIRGVASAVVNVVLSVEAAGLDSYQEEMSIYCRQNRVAFFATALNAVDYGAICALGVDPAEGGRAAASLASDFLFGEKRSLDFEEVVLKDVRRFLVDKKALVECGFNLSTAMSYMLEYGGIGIGEEGKMR